MLQEMVEITTRTRAVASAVVPLAPLDLTVHSAVVVAAVMPADVTPQESLEVVALVDPAVVAVEVALVLKGLDLVGMGEIMEAVAVELMPVLEETEALLVAVAVPGRFTLMALQSMEPLGV